MRQPIPNQLLPGLAGYDYKALFDDISRRGILVPIIVNEDTGEIIDGHHRHKIAEELGIECPAATVSMDDENAKIAAVGLNVKRRRLSLDQRREIAKTLRGDGWTQQQIADALGVDQSTVGRWLSESTTDMQMHNGCIPRACAKLSSNQKLEIYTKFSEGVSQTQLASDYDVSQQAISKAIKAIQKKLERIAEIDRQTQEITASDLPVFDRQYHVIAIDPPWPYEEGRSNSFDPHGRRAANPYPEMSVEEIAKMQIPAADDCVMWLWTTHKFLPDAFGLLDEWGFDYKATFVWDKQKIGMGHWLRMQCEFCLLAIKGNPVWDNTEMRDILSIGRREHSRKPDEFYEMVAAVCHGAKLEYFSREKRPGWDQFGNDTEKF